MRTKTQDIKDMRKLLEREKDLLYPLLYQLISDALGGRNFDLEHVNRDRNFSITMGLGEDRTDIADRLAKLFGATVDVATTTKGEGCCEHCYTETDVSIFNVTSITYHWPALELALLAPKRKTT